MAPPVSCECSHDGSKVEHQRAVLRRRTVLKALRVASMVRTRSVGVCAKLQRIRDRSSPEVARCASPWSYAPHLASSDSEPAWETETFAAAEPTAPTQTPLALERLQRLAKTVAIAT
ncbi:MAG: hypothetical protein RJA70_3311 [Pseudomonadota bacterium]|jgi:hypothetical protein